MCSSPNIPAPPPSPQEAKAPDALGSSRRKRAEIGGGTLLTSPSGVTQAAMNTGSNTLLGR